jgi:hypothetical protein
MGNTASLANDGVDVVNHPKDEGHPTVRTDQDGNETLFHLGDSFSLSKEGGQQQKKKQTTEQLSTDVFIPRYATKNGDDDDRESGEDTDTAGTFIDHEDGYDTTTKGSYITDDDNNINNINDETLLTNNNTENNETISDWSTTNNATPEPKLTTNHKNQKNIVEESSLLTTPDDGSTIEDPGHAPTTNRTRSNNANTTITTDTNDDDESIQILDAEEEFSHILQYTTTTIPPPPPQDLEDDLLLLKAQHQKQAKKKTSLYPTTYKKRPKQEPPETLISATPKTKMMPIIVQGIDMEAEEQPQQVVESRNPPPTPEKYGLSQRYPMMGMSEIQNVVGLPMTKREQRRPHYSDTKSMMIVVASDVVDPKKKTSFFSRPFTPTDQDSVHQIPSKNLLRERDDCAISESEISLMSVNAIASSNNDNTNVFLLEGDYRDAASDRSVADNEEESQQRPNIDSPNVGAATVPSLSSPQLQTPMSPGPGTKLAGQLLKAHHGLAPKTTLANATGSPTVSDLPTNDIDMKMVSRFVQTFHLFLRKHRQFDSLDQTTIDALRVLKLQKLLTTLSEVESELEDFILSTQTRKDQFSKDYHAKLAECNKKKASRKIELIRSFDELRHSTSELEKNLYWELILAFEARAKREYNLRKSLSVHSSSYSNKRNVLNLLPDDQAPAIQKVLWTEEFRLDDMKQLLIENAFLRSEAAVLEKKLAQLVANRQHDSWADAVFRRIHEDQLSLLKERHEASFAMARQTL